MPTDVIMPQMGESIFEGTITKWLKKPGDTVQRDEPLFEISTDKVDAEIPSPASGRPHRNQDRRRQHRPDQYRSGRHRRRRRSTRRGACPAARLRPPRLLRRSTRPAPATHPLPWPKPRDSPASLTDVIMPQMGESIFEGTITKWLKKPGDAVQQDEPLFEISTDKVDAEIPSPAAGVLSEIKVQAGTTVQINTVVASISVAGAAPRLPSLPRPLPCPSARTGR